MFLEMGRRPKVKETDFLDLLLTSQTVAGATVLNAESDWSKSNIPKQTYDI